MPSDADRQSGPGQGLPAAVLAAPRLPAQTAAIGRLSLAVLVAGPLLLVLLTVIAVVVQRQLVRTQVATTLDTVLATTANAVQLWYGDQTRYAQRLSKRDVLREAGLAIIEGTRSDNGAVLDEIDLYLAKQFTGVMVVDQKLELRAASQPEWRLADLPPDVGERLRTALAGQPVVTRPALIGRGAARRLVILLGLPIRARSGTGVAGALLLAADPVADLEPLLRGTWGAVGGTAGETSGGETFIAAADGMVLAGSRPYDELLRLGLLPEDGNTRAHLVQLHDPGRPLSAAAPLTAADDAGPTPIGRALAAGRSGRDLDGFRDYRGEQVVAAWRWLPEIGIGVACKLDRAVAYAPVGRLATVFLAALAVAAVGLVAGLLLLHRAHRAFGRAWDIQRRVEELERYVIGKKIGEGAMGSVHHATHSRLRRPAAIKVIRPQALTSENSVRFEREAQLTCRLTHPNTVQIFDYGTLADGALYYVMEYLEGLSLQDLVRRHGAQPPGRVIHLLVQVLGALAEAHHLGLVHRDIKPSNIFLTTRGGIPDVAKLLDFGLARDHGSDAIGLTRSGTILGSPACMPPELIEHGGRQLDGRADLYSLGCVAYWLLSGHDVFERENTMAALHAHLHDVPVPPSQRLGRPLPADVEAVVLRALAKDPARRPASAEEFRDALLACADAGAWSERAARLWWQDVSGIKPAVPPLAAGGLAEAGVDSAAQTRIAPAVAPLPAAPAGSWRAAGADAAAPVPPPGADR